MAFYSALFGQEPAKLKTDYAKFEIDVPPLVLSLIPGPRNPGGSLNHLGVRLPDFGPLARVADDFGNTVPRGERVVLNFHDWQMLAGGPAVPQFGFLPAGTV